MAMPKNQKFAMTGVVIATFGMLAGAGLLIVSFAVGLGTDASYQFSRSGVVITLACLTVVLVLATYLRRVRRT